MRARAEKIMAEYDRLMFKTKWLSQLGALLVLVLAVVEIARSLNVVYLEFYPFDDLPEAVVRTIFLQFLIAVVFGLRFILLFRRQPMRSLLVKASWLFALAAAFLYFDGSKHYWITPEPGIQFGIYSIARADPLESVWVFFIFFSVIRFSITLFIAFLCSRKPILESQ